MTTAAHHAPTATEQRLLEAAGEVFAEKGFRAATIRDIIRRAKANIAAVNYHFGDKERLYAAVFRYARSCCVEQHPLVDSHRPAEERLRDFIHTVVARMLDRGRPAWHWQLMAREMIDPTDALDEMVRESIRPDMEIIYGIVREITGMTKGDVRVRRYVNSIIGQVLFYRHAQPVVTRLEPDQKFEKADLEDLAKHIFEFSMGAMKGMARVEAGTAHTAGPPGHR